MALQVAITGNQNANRNAQIIYTASVTDSLTGAAPVRTVSYAWSATHGSFVGATDQVTATWQADNLTGFDAVNVTITCAVSVPADPNPTVSQATLQSMNLLGISGQLVNILFDAYPGGSTELFPVTAEAEAGSDITLTDGLTIDRIRWRSDRVDVVLNKASGDTGLMSSFWDSTTQMAKSLFFVLANGSVAEIDGDWYERSSGANVRFDIPLSGTAVRTALNRISQDDRILLGIADSESAGLDADSVSATRDVVVDAPTNQAPTVTITVPLAVTEGQSGNVSAQGVDPEGGGLTYVWELTGGGSFDDPTAVSTVFNAPSTVPAGGAVTIRCTATDTGGLTGSDSQEVTITSLPNDPPTNQAPTVTITVPLAVTEGQSGNVSAQGVDPEGGGLTYVWESTGGGSFDDPTAVSTVFNAPSTVPAGGTVTIRCTATDTGGLTGSDSQEVTITAFPNDPPTISITAPAELETGESTPLEAVVSDPDNDTVGVMWEADSGAIDDPTALQVIYTASASAETVRIRCVATDEHGASSEASVLIVIASPFVASPLPPVIAVTNPNTMYGMDARTGKTISGYEHLVQSVRRCIQTPLGTIPMNRTFGSIVPYFVFAPMSEANALRICAGAIESVKQFEPRITRLSCFIENVDQSGQLHLGMKGIYEGEEVNIRGITI